MSKQITELLPAALRELGIESAVSRNLFIENATIIKCNKDELVFPENHRNSSEYILLDGILHRYNVNSEGENVTTGFYMAVYAIMPHSGRIINGKSIFSLQALTQTIIAEIPVIILDEWRSSMEEFKTFGLKVLATELSKISFNELAYRSMTAKDRLIILRKDYPNIENLVPHNIIASYLGITKVSFSRLRNELARA
jgi:CRP-like cAMP-binding protein